MAQIFNLRDGFKIGAVPIYRGTQFGNPFRIGRAGTREEVIAKYEIYARDRVENDGAFALAVRLLHGRDLACWCAPRACHGSVLMKLAAELQ